MIKLFRSAASATAAGLCALAIPAAACDQHDEAAYAFLASLELRGMTEQEVQAARDEAIAKYHEKELARAKARFVRRFDTQSASADTQLAQSGQG